MAPLSWDPEPKEHTMETMTEFEADAIGAAMLLLTEALDVIA